MFHRQVLFSLSDLENSRKDVDGRDEARPSRKMNHHQAVRAGCVRLRRWRSTHLSLPPLFAGRGKWNHAPIQLNTIMLQPGSPERRSLATDAIVC